MESRCLPRPGLSHCGACHTPRNLLGAEKANDAYTGAVVDNWIAPALTAADPSPALWNQKELFTYLRNGVTVFHGVAAGPMSPVVHGLSPVPDTDIQAIAAYFADIDQSGERSVSAGSAVARAMFSERIASGEHLDPGARLYDVACASCHYNSRPVPPAARPDLAGSTAQYTCPTPPT